jgi:superfamily I DNA and/or RNA helicase
MHPALSQFPSSEFYNLALQDGTLDSSTSLLPPNSLHLRADPVSGKKPSVVFLDHGGKEEKKDRSRINWNEASIVVGVVEDLLLNNPVRFVDIS